MSGTTSQLELARSVVEAKERRLATELEAMVRQRDDARETLERLDAYLEEYSGTGTARHTPRELMNARDFVKRLHDAVASQRGQVERLSHRVAQRTAQWRRLRADLAAIDRVIDQRRRSARRDADRREQRETDAAAARSHERRVADPDASETTITDFRMEPES